ncbi:E3 ubiquitin protein ligase DRIP2-like [Tripterygium wilfordii]|uniref:E3 ubiquitin protein ligase DRIP2-like n=1 Tax=Tripterygium wilfordii TaxID=458696 RepID=A0A7J7BYT3_TRIWF|nr:E3 ubiquitin protein ligase DRIP2-like [Tripterygium wilfordii]KAF5727034.1 E3 ubiquitin protein ligase DRIP2-like [Tripterygium wilfordii]
MANLVAKVKRETIAACMTCPLCNKLFRDATTISECLHTFCRKCIHDKISEEELECCPVCNIDLGCVPLEKLRPDHNLQDLRAKIFPYKKKKVNAPEAAPSATLPARRKERSLSSLVVSTPKVSSQGATTGKRTKTTTRKAAGLRGSSSVIDRVPKKEEYSEEDYAEGSSSPETLKKFTHSKRQGSLSAEHRDFLSAKVEDENDSSEAKLDLWKPLNCLVEVANRSKSFRSNSQGPETKLESLNLPDKEGRVRKTKTKENKHNANAKEKNNALHDSSEAVEPKKLRRIRRKRAVAPGDPGISSQAVLDAASSRQEKRSGPVWFSLVASEDQNGDAPLPQFPASYLRIKDGNMPVSMIQKYLTRKLDLTSETEVEIKCMGQTVVPSLQLHNLIDLWLQATSSPERSSATIGSSAKDFVMVLTYARKDPGRRTQ